MAAEKTKDSQVQNKIERYCAFQERCRQEVRHKLRQLGVEDDSHDKIIAQLQKKGFINEARYAKAFAHDQFNLHHWGKVKISLSLHGKNVPEKFIDDALAEIDTRQYESVLKSLMKKKERELNDTPDEFIKNNRLANYLTSKGFEPELIWQLIESAKKK